MSPLIIDNISNTKHTRNGQPSPVHSYMAWVSTAPLRLSLRTQTCLEASFTVAQGHCPFFESSKLNISFLMDPTYMLVTTGTACFIHIN